MHQGQFLEIAFLQTKEEPAHEYAVHTEHALAYQVEGVLRIDHGRPLEIGPGMFTILPAGVPHRGLGGTNIGLWLLQFCPVCFDLDETSAVMTCFRQVRLGVLPVTHLAKAREPYVLGLLEALRREAAGQTPETELVLRALLQLILSEVNRAMRLDSGAQDHRGGTLVADALAFIQARCLTPISAKDVAAAVGRSPAHVTTTLTKHTGFSTGHWINAGRLGEASKRLAHTDDPVERIAEHVGWQDATHFIRQFRKAYGKTPAAWRAGLRQQAGPCHEAPKD